MVFPNPADDQITMIISSDKGDLAANNPQEVTLRLYDQFGKVVLYKSTSKPETKLNTKILPNGSYYLHIIHQNGKVFKEKIFIKH